MRDMCNKCKNEHTGCNKFCSSYKRSYDSYIDNIKRCNRIAQREREIALRLRGVRRNEDK